MVHPNCPSIWRQARWATWGIRLRPGLQRRRLRTCPFLRRSPRRHLLRDSPSSPLSELRTGGGNVTADATCSTCDDAAVAQSVIGYYGRGEVRVTWHVDGTTMQQTFALGPSEKRKLIAIHSRSKWAGSSQS